MIEFFGELSDKCKIARSKKINKNAGICSLIVTITAIIITIVFGIVKSPEFNTLLVCSIIIGLCSILTIIPLNRRVLKFKISQRITIENDIVTFIAYQGQEVIKTKSLSKIKKVIDAGEWYYIVFKLGDISNSWVCQKDLLLKGTIEEFEKLFEGKLFRDRDN